MSENEYFQRFKTETLYLWNDEYELFVKSVPGGGYFAKKPGGQEYPVPYESKVVVMAVAGRQEVTRQQYERQL